MQRVLRISILFASTAILALTVLCPTLRAENDGLPDLENAIEAKLSARGLDELTSVINQLDSALEKGLDKNNTEFAEQLLVASLLERATALSSIILDRRVPNPQWRQIRPIAVADLKRALAIDDSQIQAHLLLGKLLFLPGGNREAARKSFDMVIASEVPDSKTKAEAYIHRGNTQENPKAKLADYNRAVDLVPEDAEILRTRAMLFLRNDRHDEAIADLDKALAMEPDHAATHEARGVALLMQNKYDEAVAAFDRAAELAPESDSPHQNRARVLALTGKLDDALAALDRAIELNPAALPAFLLRAQVLRSQGSTDEAMDSIEDALALQPNLVQAIRMKAEILASTDRIDQAIELIDDLRSTKPDDPAVLLQLATYHQFDKNSRKAIEIFTKLLENNPVNARILRSRADAYLNIGNHEAAIADYANALEIAPENVGVLNNLAWVLATSPVDALRDGRRAIELATQGAELTEYKAAHILSTLAAAYAETGDWEAAKKWSAKAVETSRAEQDPEGNPLDPEELAQLEKEHKSYEQQKPWRELNDEPERSEPSDDDSAPPDASPAPARTLDF